MNDQARDKLCELLSQQGQSLLTLGRTCEMLIAQSCAEYPEEAKALIQVEKQGIAREMANSTDEPSRQKMADSWIQRLVGSGNLNETYARWALAAWESALKSPPVPQQPTSQAWSEANFEATTRSREDYRNAGLTGKRTGLMTGLFVVCFFFLMEFFVEASAPQFGDGLPWLASIPLTLIAMLVGAWIGWRVGRGIGFLQRELTGTIAGAVLGVLGGVIYYRFLSSFLAPLSNPLLDSAMRLLGGIIIGGFAGATIGFCNQLIIKQIRKRILADRYRLGFDRHTIITDDILEAQDEIDRRMGGFWTSGW
jgi:hypothetical protein